MSHPHAWILLTLALSIGAAACGAPSTTVASPSEAAPPVPFATPESTGRLNVFAAASLSDAFTALGEMYEADHPGVTVQFSFAASNQLAEQINQAAPADVFASANLTQMQAAIDGGRIMAGSEQTFVRNRLVVVYPLGNPAELEEMADLANPGVKVVFAAQAVPVGQYSMDFLAKAAEDSSLGTAFQDGVVANIVSYEENVRAVLAKIVLGEADAGIVYASDVTGDHASLVGQIQIPDSLNTIATYPIAVLADSPLPTLAQGFVALVLSEEGQAVMEQHGFIRAP